MFQPRRSAIAFLHFVYCRHQLASAVPSHTIYLHLVQLYHLINLDEQEVAEDVEYDLYRGNLIPKPCE